MTVDALGFTNDLDVLLVQYNELVHKIVHKIQAKYPHCEQTHGFTYEDLVQFGKMGLLRAAERFDPAMGYQFMTLAYPNVDGYIRRQLREGHMVKVSRNILDAYFYIKNQKLEQSTPEDIAKEFGCSVKTAKRAKEYIPSHDSTDRQLTIGGSEDKTATLGEMLYDERDFVNSVSDSELLESFCSTLSKREIQIWDLHKEDIKQRQIADVYGISQAHVSRILRDIYQKATAYGKRVGVSSLQR